MILTVSITTAVWLATTFLTGRNLPDAGRLHPHLPVIWLGSNSALAPEWRPRWPVEPARLDLRLRAIYGALFGFGKILLWDYPRDLRCWAGLLAGAVIYRDLPGAVGYSGGLMLTRLVLAGCSRPWPRLPDRRNCVTNSIAPSPSAA
jgi:hypothetical protein